MSAIFGIFNLDGRPVDPENLNRMKQAMDYWGPDGSGTWSEGPVGLGHLMLYNTPESLYETLPLRSGSGDLVLTAGARLDNRDDLFRALNVPPPERNGMPDGALILKAYEKWETDCPVHLLGDWAFALWDARQRRLFLARDHFDVSSLYYLQNGRTFIFASSLKGILALPEVPHRLNRRVIASYAPGYNHDAATPYQDVFRLMSAQTMTVTTDNADAHRYWRLEDAPEVRYRSDQEYLDAFLDVYTEAVRCRLRSHRPVGTQLSGGFDSGSIAVLAAQELARTGQRLPAFSSAPQYDVTGVVPNGRCGDETPYIEATCQAAGNIDLTLIKAKNVSPLEGIKRVMEIQEQPECAASNAFWIVALLEAARQQGIGTLLSGWGGNLTVSWAGDRGEYLRQLLKNGSWGAYLQEIAAWRKTNAIPLWRAIGSQVLKPFIPTSWLNRYQAREHDQFTPLNMALARSLASGYQREVMSPASALGALNLFFRNGRAGFTEAELGAAFGLDVRQPTMDKRLIEFCLGIPQDQYTRNGKNRLLIRRAMAGRMPESVLWSKCRGLQGADIGYRVRASNAEIEAALQKLETSPLAREFLNLPRMADVLQRAKHELNPTISGQIGMILLRGLMIGLFLQRFEDG